MGALSRWEHGALEKVPRMAKVRVAFDKRTAGDFRSYKNVAGNNDKVATTVAGYRL